MSELTAAERLDQAAGPELAPSEHPVAIGTIRWGGAPRASRGQVAAMRFTAGDGRRYASPGRAEL